MRIIIFLTQIFLFLLINSAYAEKVEKIIIKGNERISSETIIIFGEINLDEDFNDNKLNLILKKLKNQQIIFANHFMLKLKIILIKNIKSFKNQRFL